MPLVIPTKNYLLVRIHNVRAEGSTIVLPDGASAGQPYAEVISAGPDCKTCSPGENVLFLPGNMIAGFDEESDPKFIVSEEAVFGKYLLEGQ